MDQPGTDVMILKIFSPKQFGKKIGIFTQNKAKLFKKINITMVFDKNANFFVENCLKFQKIVIITSTPGHTGGEADVCKSIGTVGALKKTFLVMKLHLTQA
jgi:hypothetical protein